MTKPTATLKFGGRCRLEFLNIKNSVLAKRINFDKKQFDYRNQSFFSTVLL